MTAFKNLTSNSTPSKPSGGATKSPIDLAALIEPIRDDFAVVEQWLETNLVDDNPFIAELLAQIFSAGGKRIRPALVLLCSRATLPEGRDFSRLHIILAVLTELIHTASLVHDDVIDSATVRRGSETMNRRWNDRVAVLMGDLLFAQASICLARIMNPGVVGIYGQVLGDLCAGEIGQMRQQFSTVVDWDGYIRKSVSKTASLFAAGSHSGAILNASPEAHVKFLKEYGLNLGICFQIVDDLLDVVGDSATMGKQAGSDLRGGLITAPALFILEKKDKAADRLKELVGSRAITTDEGSEEALNLIRSGGGVESTISLASEYGARSRKALLEIPPSTYRDALEGMIDYVLTRIK